ncbi:MAG: PEP-CTERM sorting domain-containing protein [Bryobacteraceae bacterium]|nr:PEP-CTERM sorting domain-containing protein [Bryobacteraceae bacterium]
MASELQSPAACVTASATDYTNLPNGCTISLYGNTFTLKSFQYASLVLEGYRYVDPDDVQVTPFSGSGQIGIGVTSTNFSVSSISGPPRLVVKFEYILDPPPPILEDLSMDMEANSPLFPGFANIHTEVCAGAEFIENDCGQYGTYRSFDLDHLGYEDGDPRNILSGRVTFPATWFIDVRTTITLDANGGSSQIDGFRYASAPTPEPATAVLVMCAVGVGAWLRRRRRAQGC